MENDANYEFLLGYLSLIHRPVNKLDIQVHVGLIGLRGGEAYVCNIIMT